MKRPLVAAAWVTVALHLLGLVMAATVMRPGTTLMPPGEREAFLAARPWGWVAGWGVWALAALSLVVLFAGLDGRWRTGLPRTALPLVIVGACVDLSGDLLEASLPMSIGGDSFPIIERLAGFIGTVVANGLYSAGMLLAGHAFRPGIIRWCAWAAFAGGMVMVAGGIANAAIVIAVATPTIMIAYCAFALLAARQLDP